MLTVERSVHWLRGCSWIVLKRGFSGRVYVLNKYTTRYPELRRWKFHGARLFGLNQTLWNIFLATFVLDVDPDDICLMDSGPSAHNLPNACLTLRGNPIPWKEEWKYVGVSFCSTFRDIFRVHYERKYDAAAYVFWKMVLGCDHFVGRGRLPPEIGCQLYYALIDCHLTHACDVVLDVDTTSFKLLDALNNTILRRLLGVGKQSGIPQLYSELGIYPLRARRAELAVRYLRYLISLPDSESHYARMATVEADRLRHANHSSWMADLALVLNALPFTTPPLPAFSAITPTVCNTIIDRIRAGTRLNLRSRGLLRSINFAAGITCPVWSLRTIAWLSHASFVASVGQVRFRNRFKVHELLEPEPEARFSVQLGAISPNAFERQTGLETLYKQTMLGPYQHRTPPHGPDSYFGHRTQTVMPKSAGCYPTDQTAILGCRRMPAEFSNVTGHTVELNEMIQSSSTAVHLADPNDIYGYANHISEKIFRFGVRTRSNLELDVSNLNLAFRFAVQHMPEPRTRFRFSVQGKCGLDLETPGHVFMVCRAEETVAARRVLEEILIRDFGRSLDRVFTRDSAEDLMRALIFDWNTVVPMARFVYQVVRQWKWFGRRLPTMVCELAPESEDDDRGMWDFETATEDGSDDGGMEMEISF
ncbi:hypothetical protein GGX14DRAFT_408082 [Mycena pura]|uniref:Uncharacterized protein n=1 Tax=Mycena pura TaxID=153505 RepID=A0AAD6UMH8_9AGAR|nr:hypothetical protein GGX14DRAFT_408082 [Mycena pura]